jgi:predicted secreted protein
MFFAKTDHLLKWAMHNRQYFDITQKVHNEHTYINTTDKQYTRDIFNRHSTYTLVESNVTVTRRVLHVLENTEQNYIKIIIIYI